MIDRNDPSVLFFTDNEGCVGVEQSQRHPDWVAGQSNADRHSDGTPTYGFAYNTGDATKGEISWGFFDDQRALSGDCVLSMSVSGADTDRRAVRIFRRYDREGRLLPAQAYYSVWFYFPQEISYEKRAVVDGRTQYGYWNVFQLKNKVNGQSLANLSINAGKPVGDDNMAFSIWRKSECGGTEECSRAATIYPTVDLPIPVGQWIHLEMYVEARTDSSGRVVLWQDGTKIIDFRGQTMRSGTDQQAWSVNNYGILHRPGSHTLLVDDVLISTKPVHPLLFQ